MSHDPEAEARLNEWEHYRREHTLLGAMEALGEAVQDLGAAVFIEIGRPLEWVAARFRSRANPHAWRWAGRRWSAGAAGRRSALWITCGTAT